MKNLQMYCLSLQPDHLEMIQKFGYTPVGLGDEQFNKEWLSDKKKIIFQKKINIMENILSIIACGKTTLSITTNGLDFVSIENFG